MRPERHGTVALSAGTAGVGTEMVRVEVVGGRVEARREAGHADVDDVARVRDGAHERHDVDGGAGSEPGERIVDGVGETTLSAGLKPGWKALTTRCAPARMVARYVVRSVPTSEVRSAGAQEWLTDVAALMKASSTFAVVAGGQVVTHGPSVFTSNAPTLADCVASTLAHRASVSFITVAARP